MAAIGPADDEAPALFADGGCADVVAAADEDAVPLDVALCPLEALEPLASPLLCEITTIIFPLMATFYISFFKSLVIVSSELGNPKSIKSPIRTLTTPRNP